MPPLAAGDWLTLIAWVGAGAAALGVSLWRVFKAQQQFSAKWPAAALQVMAPGHLRITFTPAPGAPPVLLLSIDVVAPPGATIQRIAAARPAPPAAQVRFSWRMTGQRAELDLVFAPASRRPPRLAATFRAVPRNRDEAQFPATLETVTIRIA